LNEKLDVDGLHGFIIVSQRSNGLQQKLVHIHLSNLGSLKVTFGNEEWFKEFPSSFIHTLNHQLFLTDEMLRNDPAYKMFAKLVMLEMESGL